MTITSATKLLNDERLTDNGKLFLKTVYGLSSCQGFYGRMWRNICEMPVENIITACGELPTFKDSVDVVMFIEQ